MGRIRVGRVINRMFTVSADVLRSAQGGFIDGIWQRGEDTTISIRASLQPLSDRAYAALPQGVKDRENLAIFTRTALVGSATEKEADIVLYRGDRWRVISAREWREHGYFEGIITKEDKRS